MKFVYMNFTNAIHFVVDVRQRYRKAYLLKALSHDPFLRIRFLLVPKNGSCEHI